MNLFVEAAHELEQGRDKSLLSFLRAAQFDKKDYEAFIKTRFPTPTRKK